MTYNSIKDSLIGLNFDDEFPTTMMEREEPIRAAYNPLGVKDLSRPIICPPPIMRREITRH